jgi:hypothetical protein
MDNNFGSHRQKKLFDLATKAGIYGFAFYILFLLGRAILTNYNLKNSLGKLQEQIAILEQEKKDFNNLILYYQSNDFKELEARKKLGYKAVGEQVMILSTPAASGSANFPEEVSQEQKAIAGQEQNKEGPNWRLWWDFFTR